MAKIDILIDGYAKKLDDGWIVNPTVVLIQNKGKNLIVDPGADRKALLDSLEKRGLTVNDIDVVFLTHGHTDHVLLAGIFEKARVYNFTEIYEGIREWEHDNRIEELDLEILPTPGHMPDHCSLIVPTDEGVVVVAGDVFWWVDGEEQIIDIERPDQHFASDPKALIESRKKVLEIADFIIPGHGKMMRV
ncbi:MBL fold metallo-hydrolase [Candidatus Peregrinibacteria bacterium]|jgi:glyoxylase-like metal-dependent hydrolase (beta-lactamase superfamily II)|nr:MBL fold metallo-hydrolase [Candidatus Peregrinibacteria bacterium]MBT7483742.1 MBL fold metallo-hydrolase [Candidatus Peregrinibacteria bacterium]MBT7703204.1 MBL fold metallo-hydrolase [Candidatus Peregrinibacteria bacterium]